MDTKLNDKRQYFRIYHDTPLCASMVIVLVNGKSIETQSSSVCVHNMGPGGLCFRSNLVLPISQSVLLRFSMKILEEDMTFYGNIVRKTLIENYITEYGVKFNDLYNNRMEIFKFMNKWAISLKRKNPSILKHTSSFCNKSSPIECFNNKNISK